MSKRVWCPQASQKVRIVRKCNLAKIIHLEKVGSYNKVWLPKDPCDTPGSPRGPQGAPRTPMDVPKIPEISRTPKTRPASKR